MARIAADTGVATRAVTLPVAVTLVAYAVMFAVHHSVGDHYASIAVLWIVMTIGMMAPSAIPMIGAFAKLAERLDATRSTFTLAALFLSTYLVLWSLYGLIAAALQLQMRRWFLVDEQMAFTNPLIAAVLLGAAGVFQLSPLKQVCLTKCRSPLGFLSGAYQPGYTKAVSISLSHAAFCIGCCWLLMALAWVGGVMNMAWMALLGVIVVLEKSLPASVALEKMTGILLCALALILVLAKGQEGLYFFKVLANLCRSHH
jgi:predicted metal-binding membrane protein